MAISCFPRYFFQDKKRATTSCIALSSAVAAWCTGSAEFFSGNSTVCIGIFLYCCFKRRIYTHNSPYQALLVKVKMTVAIHIGIPGEVYQFSIFGQSHIELDGRNGIRPN
jgi:hypothetical protein